MDELLTTMKQLQNEKDVDKIGELFLTLIAMYGLTTDEVCAISYYLIDHTLQTPVNKNLLRDEFNIDVQTLGMDGKFAVAKAMVATYVEKVRENG